MNDAADLHARFCNMCGRNKLPRNLRGAADKLGDFLLALKDGDPVDKKLQRAGAAVGRKIQAGWLLVIGGGCVLRSAVSQ